MNADQHRAMVQAQNAALEAHARTCLACKAAPVIFGVLVPECVDSHRIWREIYWRWQRDTACGPARPDV